MAKILCIEDAPDSIAILEALLKDHSVAFAKTLKDAKGYLEKTQFDAIILDIELPDGNGIDFMSELNKGATQTPVIFLTGKKDFGSKAAAFSLGAEDFVVKPFDPLDLKLRLEAKVKKGQKAQDDSRKIRFHNLICHLDEQRIENSIDGSQMELTSLEFRILVLLAKTPNKIFSRSEVIDKVWGNSISVTERSVDVHISNLRKKLAPLNVTIDGVVGTGYRILKIKN